MKTNLSSHRVLSLGFLTLALCLTAGFARAAEKFTVAVLPDTREYTRWDHTTPGFMAETQFLATNRQALNLAFVAHVGDMVKASWCPYNWMRAYTAMSQVATNCDVPFGIAIGDLDYENTSPPVSGPDSWSSVVGAQGMLSENRDWQHANPANPADSYQFFYGADRVYLHLALELEPSAASLRWAQQVINEHPGLPTIISMHEFLSSNGSLTGNNLRRGSTAAQVWTSLVYTNSQVFMILCGHNSGEASRVTANAKGQPVYQFLSDYHTLNLGNGWLRLMEFDPDARCIRVRTYSPLINAWQTDANSQFTVSFDWNARFGPAPTRLPPLIITPPFSQLVARRAAVSFRAFAAGTGPLRYQWCRNGTPLQAATDTVLRIPIAREADNGSSYTVVVSDPYISVTSAPAVVTVTTPVLYNDWSGTDCANVSAFAFRADAGVYPDNVYPPGSLTETFRLQGLALFRPDDTNAPVFGSGYGALSSPDAPVFLDVYTGTNGGGGFTGYVGSSTSSVSWSGTFAGSPYFFSFDNLGLRANQKYWMVFSEDPIEGDVANFRAFVNTSAADNARGSGQGYLVGDRAQAVVFPNLVRDWAMGFQLAFGLNHSPVADASATQPAVIAGLSDPTVILDATKSSDPDEDPLQCTWFKEGQSEPLAGGPIAMVVLPAGIHRLQLVVTDGLLCATNPLSIRVVSSAEAMQALQTSLRVQVPRAQPLMATLSAALASVNRGNAISAVNQLLALQQKIRAQVEPADVAIAADLIEKAQAIIDALSHDLPNPAAHRHGHFTSVQRHPTGSVLFRLSAQRGTTQVLQASTNMIDWETIAVGRDNRDGSFTFEDPNAATFQKRFYRAVSP